MMPVRSKAQLRKLAMLVSQGKMTKEKFDEWTKGVNVARLPERLKPKRYVVKRIKKP